VRAQALRAEGRKHGSKNNQSLIGNTSLASFAVTAKLVCARGNSGTKGMDVNRTECCCRICYSAGLL
jgi:hypothetical protein